jgi:hypothetical protein
MSELAERTAKYILDELKRGAPPYPSLSTLEQLMSDMVASQNRTNQLIQELIEAVTPTAPTPGITVISPEVANLTVQLLKSRFASDPVTVPVSNNVVKVVEAREDRIFVVITNIDVNTVYIGFTDKTDYGGRPHQGTPLQGLTLPSPRGDMMNVAGYIGDIYAITDPGNTSKLQIQDVILRSM